MLTTPRLILGVILLVLCIYGLFAFDIVYRDKVDDFVTCEAMGNQVMESYPRQCRDKKGNLYVEEIPVSPSTTTPDIGQGTTPVKPCVVSGCSSQICSDEEMVSTCEYREEYACYKTATCARQPDGECGWTQTAELSACLMKS